MPREQHSHQGYIADASITDSLKLEGSLLSPTEDKKSKELAIRVVSVLLAKYGEFMPRHVKDRATSVASRVMVLHEDAFQGMWDGWEVNQKTKETPYDADIHGGYFTEGGLMITNNPILIFDSFSDEGQKDYIAQKGGEKEARDYLGKIEETDKAHEIVHDLHDERMPEAWMECGTSYYERIVATELQLRRAVIELDERRFTFYKTTVQTYGDDVHRLFFGSKIKQKQKNRILSSMTPKTKEFLFPKGYGLQTNA